MSIAVFGRPWYRRPMQGAGSHRETAGAALRAGTREDHREVDRAYSAFDLTEADGYRALLTALAAAYVPIEAALDRCGARDIMPDWPARTRARFLRSDLEKTGGELLRGFCAPDFPTVPALLGGMYVLEGSRLGGAVLRRSLPAGSPALFLGAPAEPGAWRRLLARLDEMLCAPRDLTVAIETARGTFRDFSAAALEVQHGAGRG